MFNSKIITVLAKLDRITLHLDRLERKIDNLQKMQQQSESVNSKEKSLIYESKKQNCLSENLGNFTEAEQRWVAYEVLVSQCKNTPSESDEFIRKFLEM